MLYKILFVCMGNICRSPAGEGILKSLLAADDTIDPAQVVVESAGTIEFHDGAKDEVLHQ